MISDSDESSTTDNHDYTLDDYYKLVKPLWSHKNVKFDPKINHHKVFRTLVDFSLTRTMLLSDLQKRNIAIGDLSAIKIKNIDSIVVRINDNNPEIPSSISHITNTDTEQPGSTSHSLSSSPASASQYRSFLRSKYIEFCPYTAISVYLFSRFHIPDFNGQLEFPSDDKFEVASVYKAKLLRGSSNLTPMSSSQQLKTIKKALEIAGFNFEKTNLKNLLLAHTFEIPKDFQAKSVEELPFYSMIQLAGFETENDYSILRASINPPHDLLDKIFPFINHSREDQKGAKPRSDDMVDDNDLEGQHNHKSNYQQLRKLLGMLRRSLCQDMLIIKQRYPHNPLLKCDVFNSPEFEAFVKEVEKGGEYDRLMRESCFNPQDDETESDSDDPWPSSIDFDSKEDLQHLVEFQNKKLKTMEKGIARSLQKQHDTSTYLYDFIAKQTEIMNKQSDFLRNIQNSINGLIILSSSKNKSSEYLAQQSLQDTARYINNGESEYIRAGIENTLELLSRMRGQQRQGSSGDSILPRQPQVPQQTQAYPYAYNKPVLTGYQSSHYQQQIPVAFPTTSTHRPSDASISTRSSMISTNSPHFQPALSHLQSQQQHQHHHLPPLSLSHTPLSHNTTLAHPLHHQLSQHNEPFQSPSSSTLTQVTQAHKTARELTLEKRLSRQASTLYEMWDDFKKLEEELRQHDISVTEWLKVHGSSERQFRHTRLKIIKFVEEEAARRNVPVEVVKEMLHNKMRNRLRPWTLDEVQRMLTSGRRIDLDDPRI